jgi:hypothetical protein
MTNLNRGMSLGGVVAGLVALFFLTVIFMMGDPIQQKMHDMGINILGGDKTIEDQNLGAWRLAIPGMLFVICLYIFQQGRRIDTRERMSGGY